MSLATAPYRRSRSQVLVICCVLVAIAFFGLASTLVSLLGTLHTHTPQARADSASLILEDFRRVAHHGAVNTKAKHEHFQSTWQRHFHEASDSSVQALDAGASSESLAADATASAVAAVVLLASALSGLAIPDTSGENAWVLSAASLLAGCDPAPLERPPKA